MGAFAAELAVIFLSFVIIGSVIEISFFFLTGMTAVAMILFFVEGIALYKKLNPNKAG
jgi:hypothetical protein